MQKLTGTTDKKTNFIVGAGLTLVTLLIAAFIVLAATNGIKNF